MSNRISKYISFSESIKSQTAVRKNIDNSPSKDTHLVAMKNIATKIFDPVREHFGVPIGISSFYRSPALNKAIGGSSTSQHSVGEAIDMDADMYGKLTNSEIFHFIKENFVFHQLIWEYGDSNNPAWIHVGLRLSGINRQEVKSAVHYQKWNAKKGKYVTKTKYVPWQE